MLYTKIGWQGITFLLSGIVLIALLPVLFFVKNNSVSEVQPLQNRKRANLKDIPAFFKIQGAWKRVLLLAIYYSGVLGILVMLKPLLVDKGYSVRNIAFMVGIFGTGIGTVSSFIGGFLIHKFGNRNMIITVALYNFLVAMFFYWVVLPASTLVVFYIGIGMLWSGYAMASVVVYTISMNMVRPGREGTDYSIQIVITHLSGLVVSVLSGQLAGMLNYKGLFMVESFWSGAVVILVMLLYSEPGLIKNNTVKLFSNKTLWKFVKK